MKKKKLANINNHTSRISNKNLNRLKKGDIVLMCSGDNSSTKKIGIIYATSQWKNNIQIAIRDTVHWVKTDDIIKKVQREKYPELYL